MMMAFFSSIREYTVPSNHIFVEAARRDKMYKKSFEKGTLTAVLD
jgi:hypothetical protein